MRLPSVGPKLVVAVAGVVAAGVGAGVAVSAIPSADGTIGACYRKSSGALRVVNTGPSGTPSCGTTERPLTWSQRGPAGLDGERGPAGPQGDRGPAGAGTCSPGQLLDCASAQLPGADTATVAIDGVDLFAVSRVRTSCNTATACVVGFAAATGAPSAVESWYAEAITSP